MGLLDKNRLHLLGKRLSIRIEKQWSTFAEKVVSQIPKESYLSATKVFLRFLENGEASWEEQVQALKTIEKLLAINSLKDISDVQIEAQIEQLIAPIIIQLYFSSTEVISQRYCALIVEACEAISKKERYIYELFSEEYQKYIIGNTCYRQTFANKAATIYAILDFPFGADVICENTKSTFYYLSDSLKETLSEIEKTSYSDTQVLALSDKVVDCNNLIKTILSLLSHHEQFFRAMFSTLNQEIVDEKQNNDVFAYENTLSSCITMCTTSEYTKEFGQLAAMAVASLLDLIGSPENVASLIFQLFSGKSGDKKPLKNVNINVCFDILSSTSYTNFSELAIYRGFLANLRTQTLVAAVNLTEFPHPYGYCLHSIMFQKLIGFCDASSESQIRAFAFETLNMWFETVRLVYKDATKYPVAVLQYLQELLTDDMYQYILSYVWNNWDDPIDLVQHRVKDLFDIVLKISENRKMLQGSGCTHKQFLGDLVKRLIEMDWYRKVKYALLSSLIPQVGTSLFLQVCPDLISKALLVFHNQVLSPRSSHLIVTFIEQGKKEILQSNSKDYKDWIKIWLAPVCRALSSESDLVRKNVSHYLLDRVIKVQPDSFWLAIESLQTMDDAYVSCSQYRMNAMISIIKAGKSLDLIDGNTFHSGSSNVNEKKLSVEILREVIYHGDLYLRIDVLALLCQAQKVTAEVTRHELDLLKDFLTLNMNHTSPEFRQKLYGHFTKLFIRLRGNLYSTWREYQSKQKLIQKRGENVALQEELKCLMEKIVNIKLFLTWLCDLSMASLYPGSSFQRVSSALKLFELLIKYFGSDNTSTSNGPVRENCDSQSSPFYLPLATERNSKILIETLMNPFEANRETVRRILFSFPSPLPGIETTEDVQKLLWWGFEAMTSNRADQSNCGATVFRLLFSKYVEKLEFSLEVERNQLFENRDLTGIPSIDFATKLLNLLENQLNSASQNLLFAAQNYPMHGTLMALMFIFQDIDYHSVDIRNSINLWRQLHLRTFDLANLVCSTVLNILSDTSHEGNNPLFQ
ncbi:hypothetical protein K7432_007136 [Basidiobolus ranarum]|uniref:tRNA (32-2'-O)-methyltransferase regulator THADA-like TPR repeats region domain-containing protein n=1 Tax=Basidiobolus ranarum TaxID=34480 RepID=A0ABR2WTX6_9FUNG